MVTTVLERPGIYFLVLENPGLSWNLIRFDFENCPPGDLSWKIKFHDFSKKFMSSVERSLNISSHHISSKILILSKFSNKN